MWNALPDRFQWEVTHNRREALRDSREADVRNNREVRETFSTGPTFVARLSDVDNLVLDLRHFDVSYDDTEASDNTRKQGTITLNHQLSATRSISLGYEQMETDFDDSANDDFEYDRVFLTYAVETRTGDYSISLGTNEVKRDDGTSDTDTEGALARIQWRNDSAPHAVSVTAVHELTDSALGLSGNSLLGDTFSPEDSNFDVIDTVERDSLQFDYSYAQLCDQCTLNVALSYEKEDYETELRDEDSWGIGLGLDYEITPALSATLAIGIAETDFTDDPANRNDDDDDLSLSLNWQLSNRLDVDFYLAQDERDSSVDSEDYDELSGGVSFSYRLR